MTDHDLLPDRGELTQLQRLNRERPLPIERIGHVTQREVSLSECGLSFLLTAEDAPDPYSNPYGDEA